MRSILKVASLGSSMASLLALVAVVVVWLLWRVVRHFVVTSPLDNIPGPRSSSFIAGTLIHRSIEYGFLHINDYRSFVPDLRPRAWVRVSEKATRAVRSSRQASALVWSECAMPALWCKSLIHGQRQALYVFDPTAIHAIIVKDQYVYQRPPSQV